MPALPPAAPTTGGGPASAVPTISTRARTRRRIGAVVLIVAAFLCGTTALTPWWGTSTAGAGPSMQTGFLPGDIYLKSVGGSSGTVTYSSQGLVALGELYETILWLAVALMVLALLAGVIALAASFSVAPMPRGNRFVRYLSLGLAAVTIVLAILVPAVQPGYLGQSSSAGFCSPAGAASTPCNSFWGSATSGATTTSWGPGVGWGLLLATAALFVAVAYLWWSAAREAPSSRFERRSAPATPAVAPAPAYSPPAYSPPAYSPPEYSPSAYSPPAHSPPAVSHPTFTPPTLDVPPPKSPAIGMRELDQIEELKRRADAGELGSADYLSAKLSVIGSPESTEEPVPGQVFGLPAEELTKLTALFDKGAITEAEYETLRRRILLQI